MLIYYSDIQGKTNKIYSNAYLMCHSSELCKYSKVYFTPHICSAYTDVGCILIRQINKYYCGKMNAENKYLHKVIAQLLSYIKVFTFF